VTVDDAGTEIMVPAISEVVVDVDVAAGRVLVRDIPGLTAPDDPPPP
jgi:ribosomal 30S subunit maturation factor RimM